MFILKKERKKKQPLEVILLCNGLPSNVYMRCSLDVTRGLVWFTEYIFNIPNLLKLINSGQCQLHMTG